MHLGSQVPSAADRRRRRCGIVLRAAPSGQNAQPIAGLMTPSEQFVLALPAGLPFEAGDNSQFQVQNQVTDNNGDYCGPVSFTATALGGTGPLSNTWTDTISGDITSGPTVVSNDLSPTLTPCAGPSAINSISSHDLELSVTDGNTASKALVTVGVLTPQNT